LLSVVTGVQRTIASGGNGKDVLVNCNHDAAQCAICQQFFRRSPRRVLPVPDPGGSDAAAALDVHLTDDEIEALDEPYGPHLPTAF
jgi:hypothetical protein